MKIRKIGDVIHFMADNKVMVSEIKGISTYEGVIKTLNETHELDEGVVKVIYHYDSYSSVESEYVYDSVDELKEALFGDSES